MSSTGTKKNTNATLQRPKASTVFAAAFLAGAAAAVGVNRALDVHIALPTVKVSPFLLHFDHCRKARQSQFMM